MVDKVAKQKNKKSFDEFLSAANELQDQGQNPQAIEKYLQALTIKPDSSSALNQLGKIYESTEQYGKAVNCYQQVVELRKNNSLAYCKLGRALMGQDYFSAAIESYNQAISLNPDSPAWVFSGLGDALLKAGQAKKAITTYKQALNHKPVKPEAIQRKIDRIQSILNEGPIGEIARRIDQEAFYSGGPVQQFEKIGRETIITLLQNGLRPDHKILDFGCGALRLGFWIVRLVDRGNYYGIEPEASMLETGKKYSFGPELIKSKDPRFSTNGDCDFSVFDVNFDFVVARSIFTHMTPALFRSTLKSFRDNSTADAVMLASYWDLDYPFPGEIGDDLPLTDARFIKVIKYSLEKIQAWAAEFELRVSEYRVNPIYNHQIWLKFERADS